MLIRLLPFFAVFLVPTAFAAPGPESTATIGDLAPPSVLPMTEADQARYLRELEGAYPALGRFLDMWIEGPTRRTRRSGGRSAEDKAVLAQLKALSTALQELEKRYVAGELSALAIGVAYEHMGAALGDLYVPSYLTASQVEVYRSAAADKREPLDDEAGQTYLKLVRTARAADPYGWARADEVRYAVSRLQVIAERTLSCGLLDFDAEAQALCEEKAAPAREAAAALARENEAASAGRQTMLQDRVRQLEQVVAELQSCSEPQAAKSLQLSTIVLEQAHAVLDNEVSDMYGDIQTFVDAALEDLAATQAACNKP